MVTNKEIVTWLSGQQAGVAFYNGAIDRNADRCIGVYSRRNGRIQPAAMGKLGTYGTKSMSLLVHWTANSNACEVKAIELWDLLRNATTAEKAIGRTFWVDARVAPVSIGRDERGIFETVVDFDIFYRNPRTGFSLFGLTWAEATETDITWDNLTSMGLTWGQLRQKND